MTTTNKTPTVLNAYDLLKEHLFFIVTKACGRNKVNLNIFQVFPEEQEYRLIETKKFDLREFETANGIKNNPRIILKEFADMKSLTMTQRKMLKETADTAQLEDLLPYKYKKGFDERRWINENVGNEAVNIRIPKYLSSLLVK